MVRSKLISNIVAGTAIVASLATGSMAGIKVYANKNVDSEIPEVSIPSPTPTASPILSDRDTTPLSATLTVNTTSDDKKVSPSPRASSSPLAASITGGKFDDEADDEIELEHRENHESREDEKIEVPGHKDN